jgi:predicted house-cleaning noncanonical NTP pyrophosphatase (MazG superfamily)
MKYNKLVRDKIPEIIKSKGKKPIIHIASDKEYREKLKEKLLEETKEFIKSESVEEIADILEVVDAILDYKKISPKEINLAKNKKLKERGGFKKKIILDAA